MGTILWRANSLIGWEYWEFARFLVQIGQSAFRKPPDIEQLQIEFPKSSNREFPYADQEPKNWITVNQNPRNSESWNGDRCGLLTARIEFEDEVIAGQRRSE